VTPLLVDTHALLWWLADDPALTSAARAAVADPKNVPLVSSASVWEISIKRAMGKLDAPKELPEVIVSAGLEFLPVDPGHAWAAGALPPHHQNPFDRMLIAQAIEEALPIVTGDPQFERYDVATVW
jgi:PIN domain nuclease of toxin-antitoxin system